MRSLGLLATLCLATLPTVGIAQQPAAVSPLPPPDQTPQLVINHAGPHAPIQALAFAPDGTLYAGGYGKVVHRYVLKNGKYQPIEPIRVPLGTGNAGAINAIAVSPDGKWVAVAGRAPIRGEVWSGADDGVVVKTQHFPTVLKQDYGVVYLFNPTDPQGGKVIRGPEAGVRSLAFAHPANGPVLVTTSVEWDKDDHKFGVVRVYDGMSGKELAVRKDMPETPTRPGVTAWMKDKAVQVAVAWPTAGNVPGKLLVWDTAANRDQWFDDGRGNWGLAARVGKNGAEQIVSGGLMQTGGQLVFRSASSPAEGQAVQLGGGGQFFLPFAIASVGDGTAVAVRDLPPQGAMRAAKTELWLLNANRQAIARVALTGEDLGSPPPLAASADGKWIAVGGFIDNHIEVYDAAALAAGRVTAQDLAGTPGGFAQVGFLNGNRLWMGGLNDIAPRGGVVLDPEAKKVTSGGDGQQLDQSPGSGPVTWTETSKDDTVTLTTTATGQVKFTLLKDEKPTAATYLPAGPVWDKQLKAVLAVAHYSPKAAVSLVTLFDATDGRRLMQLSGPTLRIDGLAFSGSRPLLAAVGADRVVSVWSLKNLRNPFAAVEGVTLFERNGELVVGSVEPTSPAREVLKADAIVEAVGGEKGELKPVKAYREFLLAVRELGVGTTARLRLKGAAAAVAVPVGRGVGHRHPLFDLWVNPVANKDGSHDWIGWNAAGPYDANSLAAEARLGWLSSTGNPAEPVRYAGADQYRRQYHKIDLLRLLMEEGDFDAALKRHTTLYPRTRPTLIVRAEGAEERDGRVILRTRPAGLDVTLNDPAQALLLDKAVLRWRMFGSNGKPGEWQTSPLTTLRTTIPLADAAWTRGLRRFEVEVRETPDEPAAVEAAAAFVLVPPAPVLTLKVNGEKVAPGQKLSSEKESVEILAEVTGGEDATVTVNSTGPDGQAAVPLTVGKAVGVRLRREAQTTIRVTAVNSAATDDKGLETSTTDVTVWHTPKPPKPAPQVRLSVVSAAEAPTAPGEPFVTETPTVRLSVAVIAEKVQKLEWDDGDGKWIEAEYKPTNPKTPTVSREVTIADGGKPRTLRVRVTADDGATKLDETAVLWAGLPVVDFTDPPDVVPAAELTARGTIRAPKEIPSYELRVVVESTDAPRRVVNVAIDKPDNWQATVALSPGDNRLSLEVSNKWKRMKLPAREVRFVRPPVIVTTHPITVSSDGMGDLLVVVSSPIALPPNRLMVADRSIALKPFFGPLSIGGMTLWYLKGEAISLEVNGVVPKSVRVTAGNADGDSTPVDVPVVVRKVVEPPPPPPRITITSANRGAYTSGENARTDQPQFGIRVTVKSVTKLTRVELRRTDAVGGQSDRLPGVDVGTVVGGPDGFVLEANPTLSLRDGVNQFEVVALAGEGRESFPFSVSYTPPPIRVVIDSIEETGPSGAASALPLPTAGGPYQATGGFVLVRGRVIWYGVGEAARGTGHDVVLVANEVRHLPVELAKPATDSREARFVAPLFLNATSTQVRVEVRARGRTVGVAQQKVADVAAEVRSEQPIKQQRLHVLVIAPLVSEDARSTLAREVLAAVGGELAADRPVFHRMPFKHKAFVRATLYAPLVHNVSKPGVVGLLQDVEDEIRRPSDNTGPKGWVNDVVLVYYQGRDQMGKDGLLRLHTTRSIAYLDGGGEQFAVRMDELPPTPGVRLQLLNILDPDGKPQAADPLATVPLLLRYAWKDQSSVGDLLPLFREAASQKPTVGGVVDWVGSQVEKKTSRSYQPTITLPNVVRDRRLGDGGS